MQPGSVGSLGDLGGEILLGVQDHVIGSGASGQLGLGFGGDRRINVGPQRLAHLDQQQAHAAGPGVHQHPVAGLHPVGVIAEIVGRHALQHGRRAVLSRQAVRHLDEPPRRHHCLLGIGTGIAAIRHRVAHCHVADPRTDLTDDAGAFHSSHPGQARRIHSHPAVNVREVDAHRLNFDHRLVGAGAGVGQVHVLEDLGTAVFRDLHCFHLLILLP